MGSFNHAMTVANPQTGASVTVEALVDTGATFSMLPASQLQALGIQPFRRIRAEIADARVIELPVGHAQFTVLGSSGITLCAFGPEDGPILLGAVTLESLLLAVDPVHQVLVPVDAIMMQVRVRP